MQRAAVNYQNQKEFVTITANTAGFKTACTSISFENKGQAGVSLTLTSEKGTLRLEPGQQAAFNNPPDVLENSEYNIVFDAGGTEKNLFIIKEQVTRVYGGESAALPSRTVAAPVNNNPQG